MVGEGRARAAFRSGCGARGKGREMAWPLAARILGSPAERLRSFLRRTNVGVEGGEDGAAERKVVTAISLPPQV